MPRNQAAALHAPVLVHDERRLKHLLAGMPEEANDPRNTEGPFGPDRNGLLGVIGLRLLRLLLRGGSPGRQH